MNAERVARGLSRLRPNDKLAKAASSQSHDMVRNGYFDHHRPGGPGLVQRIRGTGYLSGARGWAVAENLAWGVGAYSTPASIVGGWMQSGEHRQNVLDRRYRQIGIGVARGSPDGNSYAPEGGKSSALVVTADFGRIY